MPVDLLISALRKASDLEVKNLCAALQLGEGDERWKALLCPPPDPARSWKDDVELFDKRQVMCPDLYQATLSGSINCVNELLGLVDEIPRMNDASHDDVTVVLEDDIPESIRLNKQLRGKFHGDGFCMLREVTAEKNTMLHIAAEQDHVELAKQLVWRDNTLLTSQNSRDETPLHLAARAGHHRIVSLIVSLAEQSPIGACEVLMKRSTNGDTVLHEAVRNDHKETVKLLMEKAPALSAEVNNASISPLYLAVARKSDDVVKALLEHEHTSASRPNKHTSAAGPNEQNALHAAVLRSKEITSMLLDWKAELAYERDATGSTPLHYAASDGDVAVVQEILDKAPLAVYIRDGEGSSPLHVAAQMRHYSTIDLMIDRCPDSFELRDKRGRNFLHIVSQQGRLINSPVRNFLHNLAQHCWGINLHCHGSKELAKRGWQNLDRHGLKILVNERDKEGNTPLHCAAMNGSSGMISELIHVKADTTVINNKGLTALDHSISLGSLFLMARTTATLFKYGAIFGPQRQDKLESWKDKKIIDKISKNLIVVAVLIATIALSAAFNVPGSYNGDGVANLRLAKQYDMFIVYDTLAMSASVSAVMLLVVANAVSDRGSRICFTLSLILLWVSLFTIELAFVLAVSVALGDGKYATKTFVYILPTIFFFWTVAMIYPFCFPLSLKTIRKFLSFMKGKTQTARQIDIQFPTLTNYIRISSWFIFLNLLFYLTVIAFFYAGSISYSRKYHSSWFKF